MVTARSSPPAATLRKFLELIGDGQRHRWALVVALAVGVSIIEAAGMLLVFAWLGLLFGDDGSVPLAGELSRLIPEADRARALVLMGLVVAAFFVARSGIVIVQAYAQYRIAENAAARLSTRLLSGYLSMPYSFHLQRNSSEMIRNAFDSVQRFVAEGLAPAVIVLSKAAVVGAVLLVLLVVSPLATVIAAAVLGPLLWLVLRVVQPRVKRLGQVAQSMAQRNLQGLQQSLQGWREIVVLGREAAFVRTYARHRDRLARAQYLRRTAGQVPRVSIETGVVLFVVVFLVFFTMRDAAVAEAIPVLGLFGYAAMRLMPEMNVITKNLNLLKFVGPAVDDIHDDLMAFRAQGRPGSAEDPLPLSRSIALCGVGYRYPGAATSALVDIDLEIRAGESLGIVGPTGGGKSTLADVIVGLLPPTAGSVRVDGVDIHTRPRGWQASLGVVSQSVFLIDDTIRRNIALGVPDAEVDEDALAAAVRLAQLEGFVAALPAGLDTVVGERGTRVSGGQRQRLAIARALYRKPQVLVFDEGTSALDNETEGAVLEALDHLRGSCTLVTVAHRLSTVRSCDRVVLIKDGRIADSGRYDELAARHAGLRLSAG